MPQRVNLDAMIPRADLAEIDVETSLENFGNFPINNLEEYSSIRRVLRKPDFQRETNHWTPEQVLSFILSFLDNELIPSLILWKSESFIFVIDGAHRLSALRAWMEDDYGDGSISSSFYKSAISSEQQRIARRVRNLVESKVGRFSQLKAIHDNNSPTDDIPKKRRAQRLFTRSIHLQWVQGTAEVAETSFFKINSQGTPLDDTEKFLLEKRRKPFSIAARAIVRAGSGHKYWSNFSNETQALVEDAALGLFKLLFAPEEKQPIKTLDLPLGGSSSPVDALSLIIELLLITDDHTQKISDASRYSDDADGAETLRMLKKCTKVLSAITSNASGSLGLHPVVYFYNDRGKHSRFMFLGIVKLFTRKLFENDKHFFRRFTSVRRAVEDIIIDNKSLIGIILQNTSKGMRNDRVENLMRFFIRKAESGENISIEEAVAAVGGKGRIIDITAAQAPTEFSQETKSAAYIKSAIQNALRCPICKGLLDPTKSVSYDHGIPLREGGRGDLENCVLVHPYCNTAVKQ